MAEAQLKEGEEQVPEYEILEEGSAEAQALAKGGQVEGDEDEEEIPDETLARSTVDPNDVTRSPEEVAESRSKKQKKRLKEKLDAKDALISSLQQSLAAQNQRLDGLERRAGSTDIAMIDKAITDTQHLVTMCEQNHSAALTQQDPNAVTKAMNDLFEAKNNLIMLNNVKHNATRAASQPKATNPSVARNVNAFMAKHQWFRPETMDEDSRIAKVLDDQIAAEGFDPATSAYWSELERRIKKRLPHRTGARRGKDAEVDNDEDDGDDFVETKRGQDDEPAPKTRVSGTGAGGGQGGGRVKVTLSRERIQAMKDAGKWEDPVERNKMIKSYVQYDRQQAKS